MALYRKYRPSSFAEMIGQEQVTTPLCAALDNGRINHAYLFSGPRGTGKTSSARILARSLNCVEGPTSTPCGVCPSCVALAPGGPGNLDVKELDAASNRGVDDMRALRESAMFAPAESRYRVFIVDEAHMITNVGSNALLKIVEEPPEHLIFIFATTEPEKIIGTIRSRTHHYPFRLLTPQSMRELIHRTVTAEGVHVDEDVYPLVIRAGGGSPRDTLSILDQLLAGAGEQGLTYDLALPLLGVTDTSLIDDTVEALAARDAAALFKVVDGVIEAGHEPRRFVTDLLDRLRDLTVMNYVPDAIGQGLVDAPTDRADALKHQASLFSGSQLADLATEVNDRITELRGATSPRLLLEIMMAHLVGESAAAQQAAVQQPPVQQAPVVKRPEPVPEPEPEPEPTPVPTGDVLASAKAKWDEVRAAVRERNKVAGILLAEAAPVELDGETLVVGHNTGALAERLNMDANRADVAAVLRETLGTQVQVRFVVGTPEKKAEPAPKPEPEPEPEPAFEPPPEEEPPPEPQYSQEDEERDMMVQSQESGELDRRSPTEVAMDLLAEELGAKPIDR